MSDKLRLFLVFSCFTLVTNSSPKLMAMNCHDMFVQKSWFQGLYDQISGRDRGRAQHSVALETTRIALNESFYRPVHISFPKKSNFAVEFALYLRSRVGETGRVIIETKLDLKELYDDLLVNFPQIQGKFLSSKEITYDDVASFLKRILVESNFHPNKPLTLILHEEQSSLDPQVAKLAEKLYAERKLYEQFFNLTVIVVSYSSNKGSEESGYSSAVKIPIEDVIQQRLRGN